MRVIACVLIALVLARPVEAQPTRLAADEPIPRELAAALIGMPRPMFGGGDGPQIWVGSIPQNLSRRLYVPATAKVLGGAAAGSAMIAILRFPDNEPALRSVLRRELGQLGWQQPSPFVGSYGGFRPMPAALDTTMFPTTFCQATEMLSLSVVRREFDATTIGFQVVAGGGTGICSGPTYPPGYQRPPYPTLYNPAGTDMMGMAGQCGGVNTSSSGTRGRLRTTMSIEALLEHYTKQLRDSGWTATSATASIVGRSWTRPDSAGGKQEIMLTVAVSPLDAGCRELSLDARRPSGR